MRKPCAAITTSRTKTMHNLAQSNLPSLATHQTPQMDDNTSARVGIAMYDGVWWVAKLGQLLCAWFADILSAGGYGC